MISSEVGGWATVASLVTLIVTSLWRGWVIPAPTIRRERELQNALNEIRRVTAETALARADVQEANQVKLMAELTAAIRAVPSQLGAGLTPDDRRWIRQQLSLTPPGADARTADRASAGD